MNVGLERKNTEASAAMLVLLFNVNNTQYSQFISWDNATAASSTSLRWSCEDILTLKWPSTATLLLL